MATYIYKKQEGIVFVTAHLTKTVTDTIPFDAISSFTKKVFPGNKVKIVINTSTSSWKSVPSKYSFDYDNIAYPVTGDATALVALLTAYNLGYGQLNETMSYTGQTTYTIPDAVLRGVSKVFVFVNGVGFEEGSDFTYVAATGVITFWTSMGGGEIIQVLHIV